MKVEDPKINERKKIRTSKKEVSVAVDMTIADRLTRRARQQTIRINMSDNLGDFDIEIQQPTRQQLDDLLKFQLDIQNPDKQVEANKKLYAILGTICIDESLDSDYWEAGDYSVNDLIDIIDRLFETFLQRFRDVQSFRQD